MRNDLKLTAWTINGKSSGWINDFYDSIFFIGNGRMGLRGYISSEPSIHPIQKGLYIAGIFGEIKPGITDFVNLPTPAYQQILINGSIPELATEVERSLDMKSALLTMRYSLKSGKTIVDVEYQRFLPKDHPSLLLQRLLFHTYNDCELCVKSGVLTDSCNSPIPDDQTKDNTETIQLSQPISLVSTASGIHTSFQIVGTKLTVSEDLHISAPGWIAGSPQKAAIMHSITAKANTIICLDSLACILTSRDYDPRIAGIPAEWNYDILFNEHKASWAQTWETCDFILAGADTDLQCGLRYSMFQLMGSCSRLDPTVSIGARGLSHGRYKGCYFWDTDLFMLPFFLKNDLTAAKSLCDYRVRSLSAAKKLSEKMNTAGARYPWMAALDGSEQCETWDIGCSELHITADVSYALGKYCKEAKDEEFYLNKAAEVFIETARFWVSRYTFHTSEDVDLLFCKGPDEYCGITSNNLFTNVMVQHNLDLAIRAAKDLEEKCPNFYQHLGLSKQEIDQMKQLRNAIKRPYNPDNGHLAQDDTFHFLEPVDISTIKIDNGASYHNVCFDRLQRYKVIKQADVLLVMTRFPDLFSDEEKINAWYDFEPLCLHDSTLSFASHALFAYMNGLNDSGKVYLKKALLLDLRDVMGNTGHEGLHLACMGEAWQAALAANTQSTEN